MPQCYVSSCSNYYGKTRGIPGIIYHMLPTSTDMIVKWAKACGKSNRIPPTYARVCSNHFSEACYQRDLQHELLGLPLRKKLKCDAVPDRNLIVESTQTEHAQDTSVKFTTGNENMNYRSILKKNCYTTSESGSGMKNKSKTSKIEVLKSKCNNRLNIIPMRSSTRIAKKKSIELLSESFTRTVNSKREKDSKPEQLSDKLKFMAKLQLKHEKNRHSPIELEKVFDSSTKDDEKAPDESSLNKMQIMEDVKEGCNVQPSSPGHAEHGSSEVRVKAETNGDDFVAQDNEENSGDKTETEKDEMKNAVIETEEIKPDPDANSLNDVNYYSNSNSPNPESNKRKFEHEEIPVKRLKTELHQNFISRDKILNDFIDIAECNNMEQIHSFSEQILAEIKTLNELAKEKEKEWNNILHLKKLKEELLLRMQRKRQVLLINGEMLDEHQNGSSEDRLKNGSTSSSKSTSLIPNIACENGSNLKYRNIQPKSSQQLFDLNGPSSIQQAKRLTLDVQSIIADYRQRHPETVPRRGRRIRSHTEVTNKYPNSILNFSSMTLGSGSQMRQSTDINGELGLLLNSISSTKQDPSKLPNPDSTMCNPQDSVSFKDMLLQFAKLSQSERNELIQNAIKPPSTNPVKPPPPPYPEVTVHPVRDPVPTTSASSSSLLHGILTKTPTKQNNSKSSFSPTLARLLTAPEKAAGNLVTSTPTVTTIHPSNMSISEILSTSKTHTEITITPVDTYEATQNKAKNGVEEETEDSADRLVIDENNDVIDARKPTSTDNNSDAGDEVPLCQGCNHKPAQFVCAGCGNQWYCSRDCQVTAWDEHSEVCSG